MAKDWDGNKKSTFVTLGASNHTDHDRAENDYYATDPIAAEKLLEIEPEIHNIWECSCGAGHLAKVFEKNNKLNIASDIVDRGYHSETCGQNSDFLKLDLENYYNGSIVTNPPYKFALEFCEQALKIVNDGELVCMFLKLTFAEGKARRKFFDKYPPIRVWVSSSRLKCAMNGNFETMGSSAACYAWFVWRKGYKGTTTLKWFN